MYRIFLIKKNLKIEHQRIDDAITVMQKKYVANLMR